MTPNLYGNLVANTAAGIAGGTGVMPGGTYMSGFVKFFLSDIEHMYVNVP